MTIALMDCDSFFASCEQLVHPELLNQPVCVLSNNDGCVVARSKEAKVLGIKMGMPAFQAKKLFPKAYYISGNLGLYGEISHRVMSILKEFSPTVEIYSIDEAFIDLTGLRRMYRTTYEDIAYEIKNTIKEKVGVPVSIGVSSTKVLAKLASERAKKGDGVYRIGIRNVADELRKTEVIDVWGIGANTAALLNKYGIYTAYQFTLQDDKWINKIFGKIGLELKQELEGVSIYPISDKEVLPKSIQKTSSFAKFTSDKNYIKNSLKYHAHRACKKLRRYGLKTEIAGIMLRTKDFKVMYGKVALLSPTDCEFEIYMAIEQLFPEMFTPNIIYRSSGIILENLSQTKEEQLSLFNSQEHAIRNEKITSLWDKLENKYGKNSISAGYFELNKV